MLKKAEVAHEKQAANYSQQYPNGGQVMSPVSPKRLTVLTAVAGMMITASAPAEAHHGGALFGGLLAGAIVGSAIASAAPKHRKYYYYGGPAPVYYPPAYAYCGYPPYPPCY